MSTYEAYRAIRDEKGLRDSDVSSATGIGKSTFSDWKSGRSVPKNDKLQKIADVLHCSILDFYMIPQSRKEVNIRVTAMEGIIAILKEIYGDVSEKNVMDEKYGETPYYLVSSKNDSFILYENDIEQILAFVKASVPFLVNSMKDTRPEKDVIKEIEDEVKDPTFIKHADAILQNYFSPKK